MLFCSIAHCQTFNKSKITGSWININVAEYYESVLQKCDSNYFDNNKFIPLYLSFDNDQVKLTLRIEQTIFNYKVNYSKSNSICIQRGNNNYRIFVSNDTLKLNYNQNLIVFRKVADNFSSDVFEEYIKKSIFLNHEKYLVSSFKNINKVNNTPIDKSNFKHKIKNLFKCDHVDFVQLGFLSYKNICLPKIALYYNSNKEFTSPRVLGILIETNEVKLIDTSGTVILTLNGLN